MIKLQPLPNNLEAGRGAISWRSVSLGLLSAVVICALTPFNDNALNNTFFIGNNLPLGLMGMAFLFVVLVNGPLMRWRPRYAFTSGEMTVAFSMGLIACAFPSSGVMRYLLGAILAPYSLGGASAGYTNLIKSLNLPDWIFPTFKSNDFQARVNDPIVTGFIGRWSGSGSYPWAAWITPAITWGIFIFALFGALLCLVTIVRRQWNDNERLPFPLAQMQLALIESPPPGRFFNTTLRTRSFWIVFGLVFLVRGWNAMHEYLPSSFPEIPLGYDFRSLFSEDPWVKMSREVKRANIYLIVVGVTFFLPTSIAFSLWSFVILQQIYCLLKGSTTGDFTHYGDKDEHLGAILAFFTAIVWVGRLHWKTVILQAFRGARPGEPRGHYLSYAFAVWALVFCTIVMCGWLWFAGCTLIGAFVMVLMLLMLFVVITRVVAETGFVYAQLIAPLYKPWQLIASYGWGKAVPDQTFVLGGMLDSVVGDFREPMPVYASHGLRLADQTMMPGDADQRRSRSIGRKFIAVLALTMLVSYIVSFASSLWVEYTYASTRDTVAETPINSWGVDYIPRQKVLEQPAVYRAGVPKPPHNQLLHVAGGFLATGALSFLRLRYVWWPFHPIGFLMMPTNTAELLWFSIMIGWILKVLIVRIGGASLYQNAKPAFLGLVIGEVVAACFWLLMAIVMNLLDVPYTVVPIMPT